MEHWRASMTFKTIEYMLAILEEGGFSRAAQRL